MDHKLLSAVRCGDVRRVKEFADQNGNLLTARASSPQGNTVLHMAARLGTESLVQDILNIQPSLLYQTNLKDETPLHMAAKAGKTGIVKIFIDVNSSSNQGGHPIIESGRENILRKIDKEGNTPLHSAVKNGHEDVVWKLIEKDEEQILFVNAAGESPLSIAIEARLTSIARFIMKKNPLALHHKGPEEQTLLHTAVQREDYDLVMEILNARRELMNTLDRQKKNPMHYAAALGHASIVESLLKIDASLAYQADCNGQTPLHLATDNDQLSALKILLDYCPDAIEVVDNTRRNILHLAAKNGDEKMILYILKLPEMDDLINSPDAAGNTPLHLAAMHSRRCNVMKILTNNMKVNIWSTNKNQQTALDLMRSTYPEDDLHQKFRSLNALKTAYSDRVHYKKRDNDILMSRRFRGAANSQLFKNPRTQEKARTLTVIATFIATFTFAAAFTIPGGYSSDDCGSHDQGMVVLARKSGLQAFIITDAIAVSSSITAAVLASWCLFDRLRDQTILHTFYIAAFLIWVALLSMGIAFVSGLFVVLSNNLALAISVCIIGCALPTTVYVLIPIQMAYGV